MANNYGPPCPECQHLGRRNEHARADKKYRCVNMACGVLFYSWQDSIDAESARIQGSTAQPVPSRKQVQEGLFPAPYSTPTPCSAENTPTSASPAATDGAGEGTHGPKAAA